ncbi:uncharacterized protein DSM5745_06949 [Aspergillus mulundensis]|uniref:Uncharacterized protein n=1 Tax=Aspergillus mulundensis TaxID=1810919 RepID=A0A3D8RJR6_9EURO|nr:hypothetical protein DSM5745_06949 [Aspergillus mulundensis]RDW74287.1 hypothetical protein DSM5745_06949 [Aspergillus mulundensis]
MPLSDFTLRSTWHASSEGRTIPDFVLEGGKGGRFDKILAHRYALTCATFNTRTSILKEGPRLLAQFKATKAVPRGQRVAYNKFLVTTLRGVEGFVEREIKHKHLGQKAGTGTPAAGGGGGGTVSVSTSTSERDEVFSAYAAFLNFVEVQGGRRFSLLGLSPSSGAGAGEAGCEVYVAGGDWSERKREEGMGAERKVSLAKSASASASASASGDRESLFRAQRQKYMEDVGLGESEDEDGDEDGDGFENGSGNDGDEDKARRN